MLLGKRLRPLMITASLVEFSVDADVLETLLPLTPTALDPNADLVAGGGTSGHLSSMASLRNGRRSSGDFAAKSVGFWKACALYRRRLALGKDTYMYRGEIAFYSSECRR